PSRPETPLSAVVAKVRAPPRKLHHHGPLPPVVTVSFVIDQLPANTVRIQILNHSRRPRLNHLSVTAERDPINLGQISARFDSGHKSGSGCLTLSAYHHIDLRLLHKHFAKVICWEYASVYYSHIRQLCADTASQLDHD